jgi:hypothetical protein
VYGEAPVKLHVVYRSSGGENLKQRPTFYSKILCLLSFLQTLALTGGDIQIIFLNDGAIPENRRRLMKMVGEPIEVPSVGKLRSYRAALGLVETRGWDDDDFVYVLEDDYLHVPGALSSLVAAVEQIQQAEYFTLYDAPDRYTRTDDADRGRARVFLAADRHWRSVESSTHTFAARVGTLRADSWLHLLATRSRRGSRQPLRRSADPPFVAEDRATWRVLQGFGDYRLASSLVGLMGRPSGIPRDLPILRLLVRSIPAPRIGQRLLVGPMPSLATHMEEPYLAPLVDWSAVAEQTLTWAREQNLVTDRDLYSQTPS